jgi:PST family polysaccharide transporter
MAVGGGFVFMGAGAQHRAILQRHMRFAALAVIDTLALAVGIGTGIVLAAIGTGYWALVAMTVVPQIVTTIGTWAVSGWMPGPPKRGTGVRSMLWYGGSVTFNALIVYVAYNLDKVLLGRFAGAAALGVYGRAYQLINLPTDSFTATVSQVAFPALAKLQNDPVRLRNYFLRAYSIFFAINLPITAGCALFARDIILVFMGPRWLEAVRIFQLLVPTTFVFALINPLGWMLMATGRISRSVQMALVIFPTVVLGYVAGLRNGAEGVALGFSTAMLVLALPMILWATHATVISAKDVLRSVAPALAAVVAAAGAVTIASAYTHSIEWTFGRLVTESAILFAVYWLVLLFVFGQLTTYATVLRELRIFPARVRSAGPATA